MNTIPVFFTDKVLAESHSFSPSASKPALVVAAWQAAGLPIEVRPVEPVSLEDLCRVHDRRFVEGVLDCTIENGFGNARADVAASLPYTSGSMLDAGRCALECGIACAPVSGFHHATHNDARAYCTFNGLMVTAARLIHDGLVQRIMILDLDQHYGDGTDDILRRIPLPVENVTFGRFYTTPEDADQYMTALEKRVQRFGEFDLILYQAGADTHVDDPLGGVLSTQQMQQRDAMVFTAAQRSGTPLVWNLAGGYQEPVSKVVQLHVNTMRECVRVYGVFSMIPRL